MKKIIVFDFDGTIHETMRIYRPAIISVVKWLREECGIQVSQPPDERISGWLGMNAQEMWHDFIPDIEDTLLQRASRHVGDIMHERLMDGKGRLYDGAGDMLDLLRKEGYELVVLSNCSNRHAQVQWEIYGLERWFTAFFACETWNRIPKADILKDIAADFGGALEKSPVRRPDSLMHALPAGSGAAPGSEAPAYRIVAVVGDRDSDLSAAQAVGVPFIGCLYGYGSRDELAGSAAFAEKPAEIPELLAKACGGDVPPSGAHA